MSSYRPAIEELSGYLGVGSLQFLGAFLIIDGLTGFYVLLAKYADASAFAILFTVPLLVISYVLGLLSSLAVETIFERLFKQRLTAELFAQAVHTKREPLIARYLEVERHSRLLHGCTLAFLLLGAGSLAEQANMEGYGSVGAVCFLIGLALAALCPILAGRIQTDLYAYVQAVAAGNEAPDA